MRATTWIAKKLQQLRKTATFALGLTVVASALAEACAREQIVALDYSGDRIFSFWSDSPGNVYSAVGISGLVGGEQIRAINYWGGTLYGLGDRSRLYEIGLATGEATQIGSGQPNSALFGSAFGFANTPDGAQVVSELDINLSFCRTTGLGSADPNLRFAAGDPFAGTSPNINALAYDVRSQSLYALDSLRSILVRLDPATGLLNTITAPGIGIDLGRYLGFDLSHSAELAYLGSAGDDAPQANLYTLDLVTGMTTLRGLIGEPGDHLLIRSMTVVSPARGMESLDAFTVVPEPSAMALLALAAAAVMAQASRRRA